MHVIPQKTAELLGVQQEGVDYRYCASRSLMLDRYANPELKEGPRRHFFENMISKGSCPEKGKSWFRFTENLAQAEGKSLRIFARLEARLMVNISGGVMENAGICIDRFGIPYIPGSSVKGCARRAALAALYEWCETGMKPDPSSNDNLFGIACKHFVEPSDMLTSIARAFGWSEQDWSVQKKDGRILSDFAWACSPQCLEKPDLSTAQKNQHSTSRVSIHGNSDGDKSTPELKEQKPSAFEWPSIRDATVRQIARELRIVLKKNDPEPWKSIPNFAGSVSFLPAYPLNVDQTFKLIGFPLDLPEFGKLDIDIVTVHHKQYYNEPAEPVDVPKTHRKWIEWEKMHSEWNEKWGNAPDIEEPVPNLFPTVAQGHVFTFVINSVRACTDRNLLQQANDWLACGLQIFGLGAKTNAGNGWFEDVTKTILPFLKLQKEVLEIEDRASRFEHLSDDEKLEFILRIADNPDACHAWRENHPDTAKAVIAFAQTQEFTLP